MKPRVAFVVDALNGMGGGERVILRALELFPGAPVFTPFYNPSPFANTSLAEHRVVSTFLNYLPHSQTHYRSYLPLMMAAIQQLDLSQFDRIISFSYAVAHGVRTHPGQRHLSYTFTPMRYAWRSYPIQRLHAPTRIFARWFLDFFRKWDACAAAQVDRFAAVSQDIAAWIHTAYDREAEVIYPPVDLARFQPHYPREDFFITVSRLVAHKRLDLIVDAFSALNLPLVIAGDGPELARLRNAAGPNITFTGYQSDAVVSDLIGRARAYVSAAEEDFGIAMVEAQAAGCPVITYQKGGALETVVDGKTGLYFKEQTKDCLMDAVERFLHAPESFCEAALVANARKFSLERFQGEFSRFAGL